MLGTAALLGTRMSPVLFGMLGATPQVGRLLIPGEDLPEPNRLIILSERSWRAHYGSDPGVSSAAAKSVAPPRAHSARALFRGFVTNNRQENC